MPFPIHAGLDLGVARQQAQHDTALSRFVGSRELDELEYELAHRKDRAMYDVYAGSGAGPALAFAPHVRRPGSVPSRREAEPAFAKTFETASDRSSATTQSSRCRTFTRSTSIQETGTTFPVIIHHIGRGW